MYYGEGGRFNSQNPNLCFSSFENRGEKWNLRSSDGNGKASLLRRSRLRHPQRRCPSRVRRGRWTTSLWRRRRWWVQLVNKLKNWSSQMHRLQIRTYYLRMSISSWGHESLFECRPGFIFLWQSPSKNYMRYQKVVLYKFLAQPADLDLWRDQKSKNVKFVIQGFVRVTIFQFSSSHFAANHNSTTSQTDESWRFRRFCLQFSKTGFTG
jgi:hypothetical protein